MHEYKVTYRIDTSEVFETDDYALEADSMLEAAQEATRQTEREHGNTIISIERRI